MLHNNPIFSRCLGTWLLFGFFIPIKYAPCPICASEEWRANEPVRLFVMRLTAFRRNTLHKRPSGGLNG